MLITIIPTINCFHIIFVGFLFIFHFYHVPITKVWFSRENVTNKQS